MDFISLLGTAWPEGNFWASLIKIFDFMGSYTWTIIIFTIALKLVLSPMDFLQRYFTNKTTRAQAKLQPQIEKLKKLYGQNQTLLYQKQNELYQRSGVNTKSSCVVMIVYMALTLTIFMTLFSSMQSIAAFKIKAQYQDLQQTYYTSYNSEYLTDYLGIDLTGSEYLEAEDKSVYISEKEDEKVQSLIVGEVTEEEALAEVEGYKLSCTVTAENLVFEQYTDIKDSFFWIKNIWRPDKLTVEAILTYDDFKTYDPTVSQASYNAVMNKLLIDQTGVNGENGYYILSVIVLGVTFFSQWLNKKLSQVKSQGTLSKAQGGPMKMLMYILPVTMVIFTLNSSAIFAIYIITNSVMSTLLTPLSTFIANKIENKREQKKYEKTKVDYRR